MDHISSDLLTADSITHQHNMASSPTNSTPNNTNSTLTYQCTSNDLSMNNTLTISPSLLERSSIAHQSVIEKSVTRTTNKSKPRVRNIRFVWNDYTPEVEAYLESLVTNNTLSYIIYGRGICSDTKPHLQGYAEFSARTTLLKAKRIFREQHVTSWKDSIMYQPKYGHTCIIELGKKKRGGLRVIKELSKNDEYGDCPKCRR